MFLRHILPAISLAVLTSAPAAHADEKPWLVEEADGLFIWAWAGGNFASIGGVPEIYSGASHVWAVECPVDAMSDLRNCTIHNIPADDEDDGGIMIRYLETDQPQIICVMQHNHPGHTAKIRVGKAAPVETTESGCGSANELLPTLLSGDEAVIRRYQLPHDNPHDRKVKLRGLDKALEIVQRIHHGQLGRME